jgi:hypothetical protein
VSFNFTVTNNPTFGDIRVYPSGGSVLVSTLNWGPNTGNVANAAVVPLSFAGAITVQVDGPGPLDLVIDVNGYYPDSRFSNERLLVPGEFFQINGTRDGGGIIRAANFSTSLLSSALEGFALTAGTTYGVLGEGGTSLSAAGVFGVDGSLSLPLVTTSSAGVRGQSEKGFGVLGLSQNVAVVGVALDSGGNLLGEGALGANDNGIIHAVEGVSSVAGRDSAGVYGRDVTGGVGATRDSTGVRGESARSFGVLGLSRYIGVVGSLYDSSGNLAAEGYLGSNFGAKTGGPPWGVFSVGNFGATGSKNFVEPHASDPSSVILYSSLEGREVGTYFRGTARTVKGEAVIEVPEDFRIVTDEEGLTVQVTPIGPLTMMSVESRDLNRIVVHSSKDVAFDYLVQGVRRAFKDFEPVARGMEFAPRSPEDRMPAYLTEEAKRRLISNGTYNPDGTVNMQTADRVGWTRIWKEREESQNAAAAAISASAARTAPKE